MATLADRIRCPTWRNVGRDKKELFGVGGVGDNLDMGRSLLFVFISSNEFELLKLLPPPPPPWVVVIWEAVKEL